MRSTLQSRSFGCKLIDEKGLVQACGLAHHLLCFCVTEISVATKVRALLKLHFANVRPEEWTPSYGGNASRMDFLQSGDGPRIRNTCRHMDNTSDALAKEFLSLRL